MRRAQPGDLAAITAVIQGRNAWLTERGLEAWGSAGEVAGYAVDPEVPTWVLEEGATVVGCTTVYDETPAWGWTERERSESALFLASTVTAPTDGKRLGCVIATWALSHAVNLGRLWVGRGTFVPALARYYRDIQGWSLVRAVRRNGHLVYLMARRTAVGTGHQPAPAPAPL